MAFYLLNSVRNDCDKREIVCKQCIHLLKLFFVCLFNLPLNVWYRNVSYFSFQLSDEYIPIVSQLKAFYLERYDIYELLWRECFSQEKCLADCLTHYLIWNV